MAKSNNPYKDIYIDRRKMEAVVLALGAEAYSYTAAGTHFHMGFTFEGKPCKIAVYENKNGSTTLSKQVMDEDAYQKLATAIRDGCKAGHDANLNLSLLKFGTLKLEQLIQYLIEDDGAVSTHDVKEHGYRLVRLRGVQGDCISLKLHDNGTFQLQGQSAMLAASALDFLGNVLGLVDAVKAQLDLYKVDIQLALVRDETEAKLPNAFKRLSRVVQAQLTTALALCKVDIDLPDYGPIAYPSLKGLEGFIKTELKAGGLDPQTAEKVGEYFERSGATYQMKDITAEHVGEPRASLMAACYSYWHAQRHGIAHTGLGEHDTRVIPDILTARNIVNDVIELLEKTCIKLP